MIISEIANKRKQVENAMNITHGLRLELESTNEWDDFQTANQYHLQLARELDELEATYKKQCVNDYNVSGNKDQVGGKVKIFKSFDFDSNLAINWAIEHKHPNLLSLKQAPFKKIAKQLNLEFVTIEEEPRMTLSRDLSEFIEEK